MALEDFKLTGKATLDGKEFTIELNKLQGQSDNFTGGFNKGMLGTVAAVGLAAKGVQLLAASLKTAVADFAYLDKGIAKVNTLMDTSVKSTMQLRTELFEVSRVTGVWAGDLAEASYQALSAGIATKDLTGFIEQMGIVSKAGFTDMNTAVTATTQIMNAYGKETYTVNEITDKMLTAQNNGGRYAA